MAMMEAGMVSMDTHPDPKLPTVPTSRLCNASRTDHMPGAATGADCSASQPGSGTVGGQPRSGWPERTVRGAGCLSGRVRPDYWRPVAPAGASVVALGYAHSAPQFSSTERTAAALPPSSLWS